MYHRCIWHVSILNTGCALSLCFIVSADKVSQLSVDDGVRVSVDRCRWCKVVPRRLLHDRSSRWGWGKVVPSRLVLSRSTLRLVQWWKG